MDGLVAPTAMGSPSLPAGPHSFTLQEYELLQTCTRCSAVLSALGSFAIIVSGLLDPRKLDSTPKRFIIYLAVTDFLCSIFLAISRAGFLLSGSDSALCKSQGFIVQFLVLTSLAWTTAVAVGLVLTIVLNKSKTELLRLEWIFHLVCWGLPLFASVILFLPQVQIRHGESVYGAADLWCWIGSEYKDYRMYFFYIPLWVSFIAILISYIAVAKSLRNSAINLEKGGLESGDLFVLNENRRRYILKTTLYLVAFFCCWFPATVNRIINIIYPSERIFAIFVIHATMVPLCGFMNSIIYFWSNICYRLSSSSDDDEQSSVSRSSEGTESNGSHHFSPTTRDGRSSLTYSPTAASPPCRESNSAFYSVSSVPWSIRSSRRSSLGLMEPRAEAQKRAKDQLPAPHRRKSSLKQERGHSLHSTSRSLPLAELTVSSEEMTDSLRHVRI